MKKNKFIYVAVILLLFLVNIETIKAIPPCIYHLPTIPGGGETLEITIIDKKNLSFTTSEISGYKVFNIQKKQLYLDKAYGGSDTPKKCPKIDVTSEDNEFIYIYPHEDGALYSNAYVENDIGAINDLGEGIEDYCDRSKDLANESANLKFHFYMEDGVQKFKVWFDGHLGEGGTATRNGIASVGGLGTTYTIKLDENDTGIDKFFSHECTSEPPNPLIYLKDDDGAGGGHALTLQTYEPPPEENPNGWDGNDDGSDAPSSETQGAVNGTFTPEALCGEDGSKCNLDITKFCNEPQVARTLKFLGLLLFIAKILVPAIVIVMGFIDLFKIVMSGKMDEAQKQALNIGKRVAVGILVFILPTILITIFNVGHSIAHSGDIPADVSNTELTMDVADFKNCAVCILDPGNCTIRQ